MDNQLFFSSDWVKTYFENKLEYQGQDKGSLKKLKMPEWIRNHKKNNFRTILSD